MTVTASPSLIAYTGNGSATVYPYPFRILAAAHLQVRVNGLVVTNYTVSGVGAGGGGNVTFATAPASGAPVLIRRAMPYTRSTDFQDTGDLTAEVLDADQDAPVMMLQQMSDDQARVLRAPLGETLAELPAAASRVNKFWRFDSTGTLVLEDADPAVVGALISETFSPGTSYPAGSVGAVLSGAVDVRAWGAVCDGTTDDLDALQEAIDDLEAAGGGKLLIPGDLRHRQAFVLKSGVSIIVPNPATRIICTGTGLQWPMYGSVIAGGYAYPNDTRATAYNLNNASQGANTVTLSTAAEAANFAAGDVIRLETASTYDLTLYLVPTWLQMNVVESVNVGTGVLTLRHPLDQALTGGKVRQLCTSVVMLDAAGAATTVTLEAIRDAALIGGTWITENVDGPFMGSGGAVDCVFAPHKTVCASGVAYGNLYGYCRFSCDVQITRRFSMELGFGSHHNTVHIGTSSSIAAGLTAERLCGLTEGARGNNVEFGSINFGSNTVTTGIQVLNSYENSILIHKIVGATITDGLIEVSYFTYTGTPPPVSDNTVEVRKSNVSSQGRYATLAPQATRNTIRGRFFGTITLTGGISLDASTDNTIDGYFEYGHPRIANGAADNRFLGFFGADRPATMDYNIFLDNIRRIETASNRALRKLSWMNFTATYDSANALSKTTTFPINSIIGGDRLKFKMMGVTTGNSGSKTITLTFAGTTMLTMVIAANTSPQGYTIEGEFLFGFGTSLVGTITSTVTGSAPVITDVGITGLNFITTAYSFVLSGVVASAGDTLTARTAALKPVRLWAHTDDWW